MVSEKRRLERRIVTYYIPVTDVGTSKLIGVILDISPRGFKLDCREQIPAGHVNNFRIELPSDFGSQSSLSFSGRSKWCHRDYIDPSSYNVGYEFVNVSPNNAQLLQNIFEKYGSKNGDSGKNTNDYMWR